MLPSLKVPPRCQGRVVLQSRNPAVPGSELPQCQVDCFLLGLRAGQPHGLGEGVLIDINLRQRHHAPYDG